MSGTPPKLPSEAGDHWFVSALTGCGYLAASLVLFEFQGARRTGLSVAVAAICQLLLVERRTLGRWTLRAAHGVASLFRGPPKAPSAPPPLPATAQVTDAPAATDAASIDAEELAERLLSEGNGDERHFRTPAGATLSATKLAERRDPPKVPMSKPLPPTPALPPALSDEASSAAMLDDANSAATLVDCSDCGRQISRRAYSCPACGAPRSVPPPLPRQSPRVHRLLIASAVMLLVGAVALIWFLRR